MRDKYDDAFGDAVYDTWMSGMNPDYVDRDRVHYDVNQGYDRFECADREVARVRQGYENRRLED